MRTIGALLLLLMLAGCADQAHAPAATLPGATETPRVTLADGGTDAPPSVPVATPCFRDDPGCVPFNEDPFFGLTDEQVQAAIDIVKADATLSTVLAGADYIIPGASRYELRGELIGAGVTVALPEPLFIDADLPSIDTGHRGGEENPTQLDLPPPYYIEQTAHQTIETQSIALIVDFARQKVIMILPLPFPATTPGP